MKWIVLCLLPFPAFADVTIHAVSVHYGGRYNNFNPGIGYDFDQFRIGAVVNSYYNLTTYAARILPITDRWRLGVGVVTGYGGLNPLVAVEYDLTSNLSVVMFGRALNLEYKF